MIRSGRSFTLVEIMLAITILTVGLVGVLSAFAKSADALRIAQENLVAVSLLKREMGRLEETALFGQGLTTGEHHGEFGEEAPFFAWSEAIEPGSQDGLVLVSLTVRHLRSGRTHVLTTELPRHQ